MNLDEAETRLSDARTQLINAEHGGHNAAIALAQSRVRYWESIVFRARLEDNGGWRP